MNQEPNELQALHALLRKQAAELLPMARWLVFGPHQAESFLPEHSHPPSFHELVSLKRVLECDGKHVGLLASLLEASGEAPAVRLQVHLDRLIELDPAIWTHPSEVLDKPTSGMGELLEGCRSRLAEAEGEEKRRRWGSLEEKLAVAARIEEKARVRRGKREEEVGAAAAPLAAE